MKNDSSSKILCSTCQALCCRLEVQLIDNSDDQVPDEFIEKVDGSCSTMKQKKGICAALDCSTMLCTIYKLRPYLCRDYKAGDYDCLVEREKLIEVL